MTGAAAASGEGTASPDSTWLPVSLPTTGATPRAYWCESGENKG